MNFVFGTFGQLVDVTVMAIRQTVTPIQLQGRVVATINFIGMGPTPLLPVSRSGHGAELAG
ncbi:hypothetical protein [Kribbella alba]